jgi:hypothetical protein
MHYGPSEWLALLCCYFQEYHFSNYYTSTSIMRFGANLRSLKCMGWLMVCVSYTLNYSFGDAHSWLQLLHLL